MIKRKKLQELLDHLSKKEMSLLVGSRQVGKTTLMKEVQLHLEQKEIPTLFLNYDRERDRPFFSSQQALLQKISLEFGKKKGVVFLDEIQRITNAGLFLKGLYDEDTPHKFIISGSGSLELKENIHESLAGRKRIFEISPITFSEFIDHKTQYKYTEQISSFLEIEEEKRKFLLEEYLLFGGYPQVVLQDSLEEKKLYLEEIFRSIVEKDIVYLLQQQKGEALRNLIRVLSDQIGGLVQYSELGNTLGLSSQTVKHYLWILEKVFFVHKVTPFFRNVRKEITKSPVYYFADLGIRNFAYGGFSETHLFRGELFENFIYSLLRQQYGDDIHYWRTQDQAEVDFVLEEEGNIIPIEVKFQDLNKTTLSRSFRNFLKKYTPQKAYIINLSLSEKIVVEKTEVEFLPYWKLLLDENIPQGLRDIENNNFTSHKKLKEKRGLTSLTSSH